MSIIAGFILRKRIPATFEFLMRSLMISQVPSSEIGSRKMKMHFQLVNFMFEHLLSISILGLTISLHVASHVQTTQLRSQKE